MKIKFLVMMMVLGLGLPLFGQAVDDSLTDQVTETADKASTKAKNILDFKPKYLSIFYSNKVSYDSNIYTTDAPATDNNSTRSKDDYKDTNILTLSWSFEPDEDLLWGFSYLYYGVFHHVNSARNLGLHKVSSYIEWNMDPDPIKLRLDVGYDDIWSGQNHFMTEREASPKIEYMFSDLQTGILSYAIKKINFEALGAENGWSRQYKYSHKYKFTRSKDSKTWNKIVKYLKSAKVDLKYKDERPDNETSRYIEYGYVPKFSFKLPFKFRGSLEYGWLVRHYDMTTSTTQPERKDKKDWVKVAFNRKVYKLMDKITINGTVDYKRTFRDSNIANKNYDEHLVGLGLSAGF